MTAIRATFDANHVILPPEVKDQGPGRVIVIFEDAEEAGPAFSAAAQQVAFAKVWDNPDDSIYDQL